MNVYIVSASITALLYAAVKFFQMRFFEKGARPVKELVGDSCVVLLTTFAGLMLADQLGSSEGLGQALGMQGGAPGGKTKAFTSKPNF